MLMIGHEYVAIVNRDKDNNQEPCPIKIVKGKLESVEETKGYDIVKLSGSEDKLYIPKASGDKTISEYVVRTIYAVSADNFKIDTQRIRASFVTPIDSVHAKADIHIIKEEQ